MKKIYTLITTALIFLMNIKAQNPSFTWAKQIASVNNEMGRSVVVDASGNVYTTGEFSGFTDFDPGPGTFTMNSGSNYDVFITKFDVSGNLVWAKQLGGANVIAELAYGIALDASGNVYTTGYFGNGANSDFDPGPGFFNMVATGNTDVFISKLDNNGNFVWAQRLGGTGSSQGMSIYIDASGNVLTTGNFAGTGDFDPGVATFNLVSAGSGDVFVSKLNSAGNFIWAKSFGCPSIYFDIGWSIKTDPAGNVYTSGTFNGLADFDPGAGTFTMTTTGNNDNAFISKFDASGNFVFAKQFSNSSSYPFSLFLDGLNNIYTTGYFTNTVDFDPGAGTFNITSGGDDDVFVSKLDASGNFIWAKKMGGLTVTTDRAFGIHVDANYNVYTTGYFHGTSDFDPGAGTFNLTAAGLSDCFISKLDASGNFVWAGQISGAMNDVPSSIFLDATKSIYVTGGFSGTPDFNAGVGTFTITSVGNTDVFVTKYCQSPDQPSVINGNVTICSSSSNTYSVAAVTGATSYTWSLPGGWSGTSSTVNINATGGASGNITVTANNACGASIPQTLSITVNPTPTISVNSGSICIGNSFTMAPGGANTYTIQGGSAIVSPTANSSYSITGTSTAGCISSSAAISNITVNALPTISASTSTLQLCIGSSATLSASGASTYTWNPGGAGTSITISPTVNTTYTVTGTDLNTCQNSTVITQTVMNCSSTGLSANILVKEELSIFPNPTNGFVTVICPPLEGVSQSDGGGIKVYNTLGSLIYSIETKETKTEIDLNKEPNGIYFVRIGSVTKKIIKQ